MAGKQIKAHVEEARFAKTRTTGLGTPVDTMVPHGSIGEQQLLGRQGEEFRSGPKTLQQKGVRVHPSHKMPGPKC